MATYIHPKQIGPFPWPQPPVGAAPGDVTLEADGSVVWSPTASTLLVAKGGIWVDMLAATSPALAEVFITVPPQNRRRSFESNVALVGSLTTQRISAWPSGRALVGQQMPDEGILEPFNVRAYVSVDGTARFRIDAVDAPLAGPYGISYRLEAAPGVSVPSSGIDATAIATVPIVKGNVLRLTNTGQAALFDSATTSQYGAIVGVATSAAAAGVGVTYRMLGTVTGLTGLTAGQPIWAGPTGTLVASAPAAPAIAVTVGWAISTTSMHVAVGPYILQ
jgi:hypothetical protein